MIGAYDAYHGSLKIKDIKIILKSHHRVVFNHKWKFNRPLIFLSSHDPYRTLTWYQFNFTLLLYCSCLFLSIEILYSSSLREDISPFGSLHSRSLQKRTPTEQNSEQAGKKKHSSSFQLLTQGARLRLNACLPLEGWNPGQQKFFFLELLSNVSKLHLTSFPWPSSFPPIMGRGWSTWLSEYNGMLTCGKKKKLEQHVENLPTVLVSYSLSTC